MTAKQGKVLLICLGVLAASYVVRSAVLGVMRASYLQRQAALAAERRAKAQVKAEEAKKEKDAKATTSQPLAAPKSPSPAISGNLPGHWHGRAAIEGLGLCDLRLEIRPKDGEPDAYLGYTNFSCLPVPSLMAKRDPARAKSALLSRMAPDAAILSGKAEQGSLRLEAEKNIGTDIHGCSITALELMPFATSQLAAQWQACQGGRMILTRARQ